MLNSRIIRKQNAGLQLDVMAHLIRNYGPPPRPPVPSPLHKPIGQERLAWNRLDTRSVNQWADDNFETLRSFCFMEDFKVSLIPIEDRHDAVQNAGARRLDSLAAGRIPYHHPEATQIFYDPRDSSEPGHFVATISLQLAELRTSGYKPKLDVSAFTQRLTTLCAAAYNRQGFILANLPDQVSAYFTSTNDLRAVPQRVVVNNLCFATCLALRIRRQSAEQIIATYGVRMTKPFRRRVRQACRQIDSHAEELAILQLLASPKAQQGQISGKGRLSA